MNWEKVAIEDLKCFRAREAALINIALKVKALKEELQSIKSSSASTQPMKGGGNRVEDKIISNIVERERLRATYRAVKHLVEMTKKGFEGLSEDERFVLKMFFEERPKKHIERCCEQLHLEQSQVYRMKDRALYKFTIAMYGIVDY